jgi:hypothetical protein
LPVRAASSFQRLQGIDRFDQAAVDALHQRQHALPPITFDAADTGNPHSAFRHVLIFELMSPVRCTWTPPQLFQAADVELTHFVTVFLAEQDLAPSPGIVKRHQVRLRGTGFRISLLTMVSGGDLLSAVIRALMAKVKSRFIRIDNDPLRHVAAQHFTQTLCIKCVASGCIVRARLAVSNPTRQRIPSTHQFRHAMVAKHVGLDLQSCR